MEIFTDITLSWVIFLVVAGFVAGYIDSIAGGGGMIQIPALLFMGISPVHVLASNKIASFFGVLMATIKYATSKKISWYIVFVAILPCLVFSYIGSSLVMFLSDETIKWAILIAIPIALAFLLKKSKKIKKDKEEVTKKRIILSTAPIGFYDGLLGPGTGTYLTISMKKFLSLDYLTATASTKPLNFATNVGAAIAFIFAGKVLWAVALPMGLANIAGSYAGSHFAIKGGEEFIKKVLIFVLIFMLVGNIIKIFVS
ncbi:hypothetical protein CPU12_06165 [Malaciobacter molluscorum LMG 25693]|uniref:Probable membrane transporter protein n=1 Tax=Malaciobacter molluscorum LMG 25693 TaxID=870501 RepID=A0A2G1DIL5_9BACT|nr:TSUP family transporter [Malaciobacter molluscorum]AXX91899.1 sulfite exporter TauE/SafE family protein [Malaciobacter molluscorum LMG 25693]PHO18301.1 hypothetical protein CPU12_06165 [Malaciobacter molluscorum LMG 25693]RXJ94184.1 hypothetical protein CRV00_08110 [Malaciobacter molluscorum]